MATWLEIEARAKNYREQHPPTPPRFESEGEREARLLLLRGDRMLKTREIMQRLGVVDAFTAIQQDRWHEGLIYTDTENVLIV
mgnify:CR=1 FL=1